MDNDDTISYFIFFSESEAVLETNTNTLEYNENGHDMVLEQRRIGSGQKTFEQYIKKKKNDASTSQIISVSR